MACRSLLLKLEARGWIRLPSRQRPRVNERRNRQPVQIELDRDILEASLASVQPLRIDLVESGSHEATLFRALLQRHHYLGLRNRVGENCDVGAKCTENQRFEIHCRWQADGARQGGCGRRSQMTSAI